MFPRLGNTNPFGPQPPSKGNWLSNIKDIIGKAEGWTRNLPFGDAGWVEWAELPPNTTPSDVMRAAKNHSASYKGIGGLIAPVTAPNGEVAHWAYYDGTEFRIPADRLGQDYLAGDVPVDFSDIDEAKVVNADAVPGTGGGGYQNGGGKEGCSASSLAACALG